MGIDGDDEFDPSLTSFAQPARLHVEPIGISIDFDCRSRFRNGVQNRFDATFEWRSALNQSSERMTPNLKYRLAHRGDDSLGHLFAVHFVTRVDAGDNDIELLKDPVRII